MNNSKNLKQKITNPDNNISSFSSFLSNIKKRIEKFFKSCFAKNKIYADASTQTDNEEKNQCDFLSKNLVYQLEINKNYHEVSMQQPQGNSLISKFVEDPQFSRIIKSYSQLSSSSCLPLNLNNGLLFEPIYAEGKSPLELDRPSTAVSYAVTFSPPDSKLLPRKTRTLAL
jgi:hypothetical protein